MPMFWFSNNKLKRGKWDSGDWIAQPTMGALLLGV